LPTDRGVPTGAWFSHALRNMPLTCAL
jgi:hypothetical protein